MERLFCFGLGYVAEALARPLLVAGWRVAGTTRSRERAATLAEAGIRSVAFDGTHPIAGGPAVFAGATCVLISVPPDADGDPALRLHGGDVARLHDLRWLGYLSTTGVYGDRAGGWVDETDAPAPASEPARRRLAAERGWLALGREHGVPVHVFRLAGIYGPGRNALERLRQGTARRIVKPGHVFSRIHVDDVVATLRASMARPAPGAVYNVCDDAPAAEADVVAHAAALLGRAPPPAEPFETAALSPAARRFYEECRRVRNDRVKRELGVTLRHPDYRSGLEALAG